jgi:hypothetical protein
MVQQPSDQHALPADFDHHVVLFPTRSMATATAELSGKPTSRLPTGGRARVRTRVIREVAVVEVAGRFRDVAEELDRAIQLALAEGPRGVVCNLSAVLEGSDPVGVEVLATAGRHVRDWPGVPVAVASSDPQVREALRAQPLGEQLIVTTTLFSALSAVLAAPTLTVERKRLAAHPTAPRAAREFITRTLLDWQLGRVLPFASLVVNELVASSTIDAGTDIDLSAAWDRGALRLTIRDHGPALPGQQPCALDLKGRKLTLIAGLSRAFGILPAADGGKVVWAVLDAPRPAPSNSSHRSANERQEALILDHARGLAESPIPTGSGPSPAKDVVQPASGGGLTLIR